MVCAQLGRPRVSGKTVETRDEKGAFGSNLWLLKVILSVAALVCTCVRANMLQHASPTEGPQAWWVVRAQAKKRAAACAYWHHASAAAIYAVP